MSLDLAQLPEPVAQAVRSSYGDSMGQLFMIAAVLAVVTLVAAAMMKSTQLRAKLDTSRSGDES
jgi:hypothetical protein